MFQRISLVIADVIGINGTFLLALFLHYEEQIPGTIIGQYIQCALFLTIGKLLVFKYFELYDSVWEYASIEELIKVVEAVVVGNMIGGLYMYTMSFTVFYGIYIIYMQMEFAYLCGIRFSYRIVRRLRHRTSITIQDKQKHVLIIGSGSTACLIASEIKNHPRKYGERVGFIDDDPHKLNKTVSGVKVLGNTNDIYSISKRYHVDEIILAIPTASKHKKREVLRECRRCEAKVRILPGVQEIIDGQVSMNKIRDVQIEDLLGREPVNLNVSEIAGYIEDNVILVTGGGGSIGSELCRQIIKFEPRKLVILDIYENNAYDIQNELRRKYPKHSIDVIIASVRDRNSIMDIIGKIKPRVIFHAAAHKHVPLMERCPKEAVKNNTFGTMNVAEAAMEHSVKCFVLISTDKAVNPTNIMGASKRMCEMVIQGLAQKSINTKFVAVRFGNVLGSNGSVIPLFKRQIKEGGPVTVTHKDIVRYFMTIPEAAQLVIQAGAIARGGETFVLDMGEPVKIYDLAVELIRQSGLKPFDDIDIDIVGLRPGEKLYEELLMEEEGLEGTKYAKIYIGQPMDIEYSDLKRRFGELKKLLDEGETEEVVGMIRQIVTTYRDSETVNDEESYNVENIDNYRTIHGYRN